MAFPKNVEVFTFLSFILLMWINFVNLSLAEPITSTASAPVGVKKCYKCEGDCNGGPGTVEECYPDSDTLIFACYTIVVEGKAFQRGCTVDFSEGESCVQERGNLYCFCRTDECNKSVGASRSPTRFGIIILVSIIISVISRKMLISA